MNRYILSAFCYVSTIFFITHIHAQKNRWLQSGPMVGYASMREVLLWVQTKQTAFVHFEYWKKGKPKTRQKSEVVQTHQNKAYIARIPITLLEPNNQYEYELFINQKKIKRPYPLQFQTQDLWAWRTDPPYIRFAFGSCAYVNDKPYDRPGIPYGSGYEIFSEIHKKKPLFMIWGGDNMYLREADFDSKSGIMYRYTHTRKLPELQPLLGSVHHYAIWDDHDFGPNDSDRSYTLKHHTSEAFRLFWGNPTYGIESNRYQGITSKFYWGDLDFFLLDNRFFRSPNSRRTGKRQILGEQQIEWLIDGLKNSRSPFKFVVVGGQVLNPEATFENHAQYAQERQNMISKIRAENIAGVFFLSGDRHHTELSKLKENNKVAPLYDLTCSPLTAKAHATKNSKNTLIVPNTVVNEHNFAILEVSGKRNERILKISIFDKNGKVKWTKSFSENDLKNK